MPLVRLSAVARYASISICHTVFKLRLALMCLPRVGLRKTQGLVPRVKEKRRSVLKNPHHRCELSSEPNVSRE